MNNKITLSNETTVFPCPNCGGLICGPYNNTKMGIPRGAKRLPPLPPMRHRDVMSCKQLTIDSIIADSRPICPHCAIRLEITIQMKTLTFGDGSIQRPNIQINVTRNMHDEIEDWAKSMGPEIFTPEKTKFMQRMLHQASAVNCNDLLKKSKKELVDLIEAHRTKINLVSKERLEANRALDMAREENAKLTTEVSVLRYKLTRLHAAFTAAAQAVTVQ